MSSKSPTGIIPEELMYPARLNEVLAFIEALPMPGDDKADVLFGWARTVGVRLNSSQFARVKDSGIGGL